VHFLLVGHGPAEARFDEVRLTEPPGRVGERADRHQGHVAQCRLLEGERQRSQ
jgi:hypothetical protein